MKESSTNTTAFSAWLVFACAWLGFLAIAWSWNLFARDGWNEVPPHWNIDGIFYDNIATNLADGRGFVVDFDQTKWRSSYEAANQESGAAQFYKWVLQFEGSGPTTMRSPGYPALLALTYRTFGWRFDIARMIGLILASCGTAMIATWAYRHYGLLTAVLTTATIAADYSVMQTSGLIASEPLAVFAFALAFVSLSRLFQHPSFWQAGLSGASFALLFLTRGNWNLGLLLVLAMLPGLLIPRVRNWIQPVSAGQLVILLAVAVSVGMPWWIRNCNTTQHFQPFGTAGTCGLVAAYCDASLADYGNWKAAVFHQNQKEVFASIDFQNTPLAEREFLVGRSSLQKAREWAFSNWYRLPKLAVYRYLSHWGIFNPAVPLPLQMVNLFWLACSLIGCLGLSGKWRGLIAFVLLIDALIVMLTWAHLGRYGIPVRPLLHVGCAITVIRFWQYILFRGKS